MPQYRSLQLEPLEAREVLSGVGVDVGADIGTLPTAPPNDGGTPAPAVYAPETLAVNSTSAGPVQEGESVALASVMANPPNSRISVPGIPPGDAGGVGGGNGPGRLPLQIPGFGGTGNYYDLNLYAETLPEIVWLYAFYFRNQQRVVPEEVDFTQSVARNEEGVGPFGVKLFELGWGSFDDGTAQDKPKVEQPTEEEQDQQPERDEQWLQEREIEREIERTLEDVARERAKHDYDR